MAILLKRQWALRRAHCLGLSFTYPLASLLLLLSTNTTTAMISVGPTDVTAPFTTTGIPSASPETGGRWCVAGQPVAVAALQAAMDYACGRADCSAIQPGASCFEPVTVHDHASYALNSYYQADPVPASCDFGGSAVVTSTDPSYGSCRYPSTSMSSSMLNTSDSSGARVFGAGPVGPSTSAAAAQSSKVPCSRQGIWIAIFMTLLNHSWLIKKQFTFA